MRSVNAHAARVEALELALEALKVLGLPRDYHLNHAERMLRETLQGVVQL